MELVKQPRNRIFGLQCAMLVTYCNYLSQLMLLDINFHSAALRKRFEMSAALKGDSTSSNPDSPRHSASPDSPGFDRRTSLPKQQGSDVGLEAVP